MNAPVLQWKRHPGGTAAANTAIKCLIDPGNLRGRSVITRMAILNQGTAQTLSIMQVLKKFRIHAAAASGQAVIRFHISQVAQNVMAALDQVAIKMPNGKHELYQVSSVSATSVVADDTLDTYTVTLTSNLSAALEAGAAVCFFGVSTDGHEQVTVPVSATTVYAAEDGYFGANEMGEPLLVYLNNITAAATIQGINCPVIGV